MQILKNNFKINQQTVKKELKKWLLNKEITCNECTSKLLTSLNDWKYTKSYFDEINDSFVKEKYYCICPCCNGSIIANEKENVDCYNQLKKVV